MARGDPRENGAHHRGRSGRATGAGPVNRQFAAARPDELYVADFTYVPMVVGFGYTAFVIDAFAGLIIGWQCSLSKQTAFVERAIRQAAARRRREAPPLTGQTVHHSDAGSQYTAVHLGETLLLKGLIPSIGTVASVRSPWVSSP